MRADRGAGQTHLRVRTSRVRRILALGWQSGGSPEAEDGTAGRSRSARGLFVADGVVVETEGPAEHRASASASRRPNAKGSDAGVNERQAGTVVFGALPGR